MSDVRSYEEWKPVPGYEDLYEVSTLGRVRRGGRLKRLPINNQGRRNVGLWRGGKGLTVMVHRLVAETFLGPCPEGLWVCHRDGDCLNNQVSNLYYGSPSDNAKDRVAHGNHFNAEKTHCIRGHEFTPENTYKVPTGGRRCKACVRMMKKAREDERRSKLLPAQQL